jgi:hypothetical protein
VIVGQDYAYVIEDPYAVSGPILRRAITNHKHGCRFVIGEHIKYAREKGKLIGRKERSRHHQAGTDSALTGKSLGLSDAGICWWIQFGISRVLLGSGDATVWEARQSRLGIAMLGAMTGFEIR